MKPTISVELEEGGVFQIPAGTNLLEIYRQLRPNLRYPALGAIVNNKVCDLWEEPQQDCKIKFLDRTDPDGGRLATRGMAMILVKAAHDVFPDYSLKVLHSLSGGIYCRRENGIAMRKEEVRKIESRMREIIAADHKFERLEITIPQGIEIFKKQGLHDKVRMLKFRRKKNLKIYKCDDYYDYFFGRLPASTGVLKEFELKYYPPGFIIRFPRHFSPDGMPAYKEQRKLARIYSEHRQWADIINVSDVASLNSIIAKGEINDLIRVMEAFHEKRIAYIADLIARNIENLKIILIAGPSSSGKTTFAQRLMVQLKVNGLRPVTLSLDDYFVDKHLTPRDEEGNFDFEHIDAIDISLFNDHLERLLRGEEVSVPRFDFKRGCRVENHKRLKMKTNDILIIEGIHGLNGRLTESVPAENKYKIYVSALTALNLDNHNRIPTTDLRIIRRIVRDSQFRNHSAMETIYQWPSVRRGEERFIFPYQEEADVMFNSALIYELAALKTFVEPLLREIPPTETAYAEAKRLLSFTDNFLEIGTDEIPPNSILREFIGATCFFKMDLA